MKHQRKRLPKRFDEQPRGDIRDNHHRNNPAENHPENPRENYVGIPRNVEKIKIPINESLCADDPKTHRRQAEHDGVMHGDTKAKRREVEKDGEQARNHTELG